jgi:hypothetical protein
VSSSLQGGVVVRVSRSGCADWHVMPSRWAGVVVHVGRSPRSCEYHLARLRSGARLLRGGCRGAWSHVQRCVNEQSSRRGAGVGSPRSTCSEPLHGIDAALKRDRSSCDRPSASTRRPPAIPRIGSRDL